MKSPGPREAREENDAIVEIRVVVIERETETLWPELATASASYLIV